jgi:nucleotide-binding universal stress UspA family protein
MRVIMSEWYNLLVAVDEMESSIKAVSYVGKVAGNIENVSICLLNVYPEPPPDFYVNGGELKNYQTQRIEKAEAIFERCIEILTELSIQRQKIYCTTHMAESKTISETILEVREKGDFGTVVTGKRGVSKAEEFLFGSISNALARHSNNFSTWIVG